MNNKKIVFLLICFIGTINTSYGKIRKGIDTYQVGKYQVHVLTEKMEGNTNILLNPSDSILEKYAPNKTFEMPIRAYLVNDGNGWILFDSVLTTNIFNSLDSLDVSPSDIQKIYLTHMHRDHIGGLLKDGKPMFPNATIVLSEKEYSYWTNDDELDKVPAVKQRHGLLAQNVINAYKNRITAESPIEFDSGGVKKDGIYMIEAYGHTPGHVMYFLKSNSDEMLIWGDIMHILPVQIPHPEISVQFDIDPSLAKDSRLKIMDYVSENNIAIAGAHIPSEGIGYIRNENSHYSFEVPK